MCCTQDREGSASLPQVNEHGGPPSHHSQQEAVRVESRQEDPQGQGVGDAAGTRTAVSPEQVLSSCSELCAFPTMWLRFGRSLASWCLGTGCDSRRMSLRECRPPLGHGVVLASWVTRSCSSTWGIEYKSLERRQDGRATKRAVDSAALYESSARAARRARARAARGGRRAVR